MNDFRHWAAMLPRAMRPSRALPIITAALLACAALAVLAAALAPGTLPVERRLRAGAHRVRVVDTAGRPLYDSEIQILAGGREVVRIVAAGSFVAPPPRRDPPPKPPGVPPFPPVPAAPATPR